MDSKGRVDYLDMAKGIAILLVILGHTYSENPIKIWLYSFHLPLFFFVSGCILNLKKSDIDIRKSIKGRLKSLILPYFSLSFLIFSIWFAENYIIGKTELNNVINKTMSIMTFKGIDALWFLPCLFASEIIFLILIKYLKHKKNIIPLLVLFSVLPFISTDILNNKFPLEIMRILIALVFLGAGYCSFNIVQRKNYNIIFLIGLLITNIILGNYNGFVDLFTLNLKNYFIYFSSALIGALAIILICKKVKNIKVINFLGVNSLIIMATHIQLIFVVRKILSIVIKQSSDYIINNLLLGLTIVFIVTLIEIPIIYIINKYFYYLIGKKKIKSTENKKYNLIPLEER